MIENLSFYFRHSLNDLRVNGQRTFFALLCIAAGVAAVVSLQTIAVMMGDTLTGNLQRTNRGDIQLSLQSAPDDASQQAQYQKAAAEGVLEAQPPGLFGGGQYRIGKGGLGKIQAWFDAHYPGQIEMTYPWVVGDLAGIFTGGVGTSVTVPSTGASASQVISVLIDPKKYPFYGEIKSIDGKPLADLLQSPKDIVVDKKVAEAIGAKLGDTLRVNGATTDFMLRGIVPTDSEVTDPASSLFTALFGFYYLDRDAIQYFEGVTPQTDKLYLRLSNPSNTPEISRAFSASFPYVTTTTVDTLRQNNQALAERINQLVTVVGLVSLLLGSIGIINTMQVIVRRRTVEVAVLKTIGLEAGQITILFLVEAFIMGLIGSLAGIVLGWVTTFLIRGVAENLVGQPLPFRIALLPVVNGLIVGTLVTTIFGFLPTLAAGQVRPGVVLHPTGNITPRAGRLRTLLALLVIVLALSGVAYMTLGSFPIALAVTIGAFMAAGLLILLLSFLIWLIGHFFPTLGIVDLKISLRQMLAERARGAMTLLALVVGVFSLSLITLFTSSLNTTLSTALGTSSGGNVIIALANQGSLPAVTKTLDSTPGVHNWQVLKSYKSTLISVQDPDGTILSGEQIRARLSQNADRGENASVFDSMTGRAVNLPPMYPVKEGRSFTEADAGKQVIVFTDSPDVTAARLKVGDKLTYAFGEGTGLQQVTFDLIGFSQRPAVPNLAVGSGPLIPLDALPESILPDRVQVLAAVDESTLPQLRRNLSSVPGTYLLETAVFNKLITSLLATFTAFPTMVALLGLIVGGVVIANSVALTTMERRREIAVMKAVGLQRERVLGMLLLENGLMGFIGGLIGVGLALLALVILSSLGGGVPTTLPYGTALLLMLLCILVALVAATTTAWGASGEKPLNVLRSE